MRTLSIAALAMACAALAGCEQSKSEAATAPPPAKTRSLARPAQMYAGQEQILSVQSGTLDMDQGKLVLKVDGQAAAPGYSDAAFLPRIYAAAPKDGIYEVDVIATTPKGAVAPAPTPIEVEKAWPGYPQGRLKGVKFMTKTNEVVAMLPAAKTGS